MKNTYIHLNTSQTSYVLNVNSYGHLENLYYGARLDVNEDFTILINKQKNMMGTATMYKGEKDDVYCLDYVNLELGTLGKGDYRRPSTIIEHELGFVSDFKVIGHGYGNYDEVLRNELPIPRDPDSYYFVDLKDEISGVRARLEYLIFKAEDVIARRIIYFGDGQKLTKASSMNLDLDNNQFVAFSTYGTWVNEINVSTHKLVPGVFEISTNVGPSSNRHNPFFLLLNENTTLDQGVAYGFNLVYSGPFKATMELTFSNKLRIQHGINDETFSHVLQKEEPFITPFAIMTFSNKGENGISNNFQPFVRNHIVRPEYSNKSRPILLNNWEGTYFDFTEKKVHDLIDSASKLGIELFVLDDGWFINRNDDYGGLGNYKVNKKKLPHGLRSLSDYAKKKGMQFGLWFEPEMVSKDHDIFKEKPEWVVQIPGFQPSTGRFQYCLDLTLKEVQNYIIENVANVLSSADISYVKWDYNRNLSDFYSKSGKFGTFFYDYTRGLYAILKALTMQFPNILWEGCASGGNRFDLGTLSYFDQIWVSDCSDAHERIRMQSNLAKAYPLSVLAGHVSDVPNHQMLRDIPLQTRLNNAFMTGGFGYELDVTRLNVKNAKQIKIFNEVAKQFQPFIINSNYYELPLSSQKDKKAFGVVSYDKEAAIVLVSNGISSTMPEVSKLPALELDDQYLYEVRTMKQTTDITVFGSLLKRVLPKFIKYDGKIIGALNKRKTAEELIKIEVLEHYVVSGAALKAGALTLYPEWSATGIGETTRTARDFTSILYFITKK